MELLIDMLLLGVATLFVLGFRVYYLGRTQQLQVISRTALDVVEARAGRLRTRFDVRLRRTALGRWTQTRIDRSGVPVSTGDWLLLCLSCAVIVFVALSPIVAPIFAVAAAVAGVRVCFYYLDRRQQQRRDEFVAQLPTLARILSNGTSAGLALRTALAMSADEIAEPAKSELRTTTEQLALGHSIDDALLDLRRRLPSRELSVLVDTLVIQNRAGGAVVTALANIAATLDARKDLRRELRTIVAGAVFTSYIVIFLGVAALFLLNLIQPGLLNKLTHQTVGQISLVVAVGMYAVGFVWIRRLTRVEV